MRTHLLRTLLLAAMAATITTYLPAQGPGGAPPGPPPQGGRPAQSVGSPTAELDRLIRAEKAADVPLSDAQKVTILGIYEDRETAMEALRKSGQSQTDGATQAQQLLTTSNASIRAVLSEAQAKILDMLQTRRQPNRNGEGSAPASAQSRSQPGAGNGMIDANTGGDPTSTL